MADIILPPMLQVFLDKLASPVLETFSNMLGVEDNVRKLQSKLPTVQALLEDAEERQATDMAVRIWLSKLTDVGHDVEDLILEFSIHDARITNAAYADKVRTLLSELDMIVDEGLRLNLREKSTVRREWDRRETSYFIVESEVYGREEEKEEIVEYLIMSCEAVKEGSVSCIPIVGLGGLGKTTLAQLVYNDPKVSRHFDVKLWVFVSDHFDAKNIMIRIIESLTKDKCHCSSMNALHSEVWCLLHKKRYLIVLDDVWTENEDDWDKLKPLFRGGTYGSKVLITTRSTKVALMTDCPTFPYYLKGLSEDACWSLFKQRAFRLGEAEAHQNLLLIGHEIVRKCRGVALAAKSLGSLMRFKREEKEWLSVQESELWNLEEGESGILPALKLSYSRLPLLLKRCFSFCSIFPRGYEFKKEKLIQMWMAEGFIESSSGNKKTQEDVGTEYFKTLQWMSFFQEIKQCENSLVTGYKIHDVIYDLLQSIVGSDYALLEQNSSQAPGNFSRIRHSSVVGDFKSSLVPKELYKATRLRTLLSFSGGNIDRVPLELYSSFKYLLVLNLSGSGLFTLDASIDLLACLRYLDLAHTLIKSLPISITSLSYLQTLNLFNCYELQALPDILKMRNLRHLNNDGCEALNRTLSFMSLHDRLLDGEKREWLLQRLSKCSKKLRTLSLLVVGGAADIMFLQQLNQLQGSLKITHLENVHAEDASVVNLMEKKGIESLGLYWGDDDCDHYSNINSEDEYDIARFRKRNESQSACSSQGLELDASIGEQVLESLQPHHNLQRLVIKGYPGTTFPLHTIFHLKALHLFECRRAEHLPILGNLRFLKSLLLQAMHRVQRIEKEFYGKTKKPFPELRELVLIDFPILEQWSSPDTGSDPFPSLRKLVLNKCKQLTAMPIVLSIQHLELRDCKSVLVHCFQNLTSLRKLAIEKVNDLLCFPGAFPSNNLCLTSLEIKSLPQLRLLPSQLGNLASLKSLTIRWCEELALLPQGLQNLNALESLEICDCHGLTRFPENEAQGLSNLRTLSIENCNNLTSLSMGFQYLTSLENLTIMYCPSVCELPRGVEYLSSLHSLTIISCPRLTSLPEELQRLNVLHTLEIRICPGLKALPNWIEKLVSLRSFSISDCCNITCLPQGIELLTTLQHLSIQDCPRLVERCRQRSSEDWPKIAHVPYKHIGISEQWCTTEEASSSSN